MLNVKLDEMNFIAIPVPDGVFTKDGFVADTAVIDSYIENTGQLKGFGIYTESFPR